VGLIKTAAKVAVASSVHGRVQRRQQRRWAQDSQQDAAPAPPAAPVAGGADGLDRKIAQLAQLGELRVAGVLTDAEFEAKKSLISGWPESVRPGSGVGVTAR
jgi:hypothetical protein